MKTILSAGKKSITPLIVCAAMGISIPGCGLFAVNDSPIVGEWSIGTGGNVESGTIYHYSSSAAVKSADTTLVTPDLSGSTLNFSGDNTVTQTGYFFSTPITISGTWSYVEGDSMLTMLIEGSSTWPTSRTGKLNVSGNGATITYPITDTLSHGTTTMSNGAADTYADVFVGTQVITMSK